MRLYGSLSATGTGHGTDAAVVAGLLGTAPESCPAGLLQELMDDPHTRRKRSLGDGQVSVCVDDVSHDAIIHDFPYSNTLVADLLVAEDKVLHSRSITPWAAASSSGRAGNRPPLASLFTAIRI